MENSLQWRFQEVSLLCGGLWKNVGLLVLVLKSCGVRFKWCVSIRTFKQGHKGRSQIARFVLHVQDMFGIIVMCGLFVVICQMPHFKKYDCIRFNQNIKLRPFLKKKR